MCKICQCEQNENGDSCTAGVGAVHNKSVICNTHKKTAAENERARNDWVVVAQNTYEKTLRPLAWPAIIPMTANRTILDNPARIKASTLSKVTAEQTHEAVRYFVPLAKSSLKMALSTHRWHTGR